MNNQIYIGVDLRKKTSSFSTCVFSLDHGSATAAGII